MNQHSETKELTFTSDTLMAYNQVGDMPSVIQVSKFPIQIQNTAQKLLKQNTFGFTAPFFI